MRRALLSTIVVLVLPKNLFTGDLGLYVRSEIFPYSQIMAGVTGKNAAGHPLSCMKVQVSPQFEHRDRNYDELPVPQECAGADFERFGRPLMFNNGIGLSVGTKQFVHGDRIPLYTWVVNESDKPRFIMTCNIDWFTREAFDLFDANGDRVLSIREQQSSRHRAETNPQSHRPPICPFTYNCSANARIKIAPHVCTPEPGLNLADSYVLTPGDYVLSAREILDCSRRQGRFEVRKAENPPAGQLHISILAR
jgi:hypothetical protein